MEMYFYKFRIEKDKDNFSFSLKHAVCKISHLLEYFCPSHCQPGLCSWVQEASNDVNWTRSSGLQVPDQPWDGPQSDHTVGNNEGNNQSVFLKTLNELRVKSWPKEKKYH